MLRVVASDKTERFRSEFRAWLSSAVLPDRPKNPGLDEFILAGRAWQSFLAKHRWIGVHWPESAGGRGLSLVEEAIVQEELVRARAPQMLGLFGLTMVGPVLIEHGTSQQKTRHLEKILQANEIWCQGFSEPQAGSDLAAISTKALRCEGGYRLTGQKVWTSFAHIADWCFLLARTSSTGKRHEGLTYFLINMKTPGITVRPLRQISGDDEFNELFLDDVFVPSDCIVGEVGAGWKIAISTLMHERVILTFARQLQSEVTLREMVDAVQNSSENEYSSEICSRLASSVAEACAVRALSYKHLQAYAAGQAPGAEGSLDKLFWSESYQRVASLHLDMAGIDGAGREHDSAASKQIHDYLYSRGRTIAAGTSEIQRSIIAERILELPRGGR
jgi:alkylation response protein AidB-like acyl-CoA dehydrogenase